MKIIRELEAIGYKVFTKNNKLFYEYKGKGEPNAETAIPLLKKLKGHKVEAISYLKFAQSNVAVKIHSNLLNEDIWFISDEKMRELLDDDLVVYLPGEIKHLSTIKESPEHVKKIHDCKKIFPGSQIVWN